MLKRLKIKWKRFMELMNNDGCYCSIHRCTELNLIELKIIKDSLEDFDPEDDMWDERTSAYKYMYGMDDLKDLKETIEKIVKARI